MNSTTIKPSVTAADLVFAKIDALANGEYEIADLLDLAIEGDEEALKACARLIEAQDPRVNLSV